jgi:hypothetical protein
LQPDGRSLPDHVHHTMYTISRQRRTAKFSSIRPNRGSVQTWQGRFAEGASQSAADNDLLVKGIAGQLSPGG